MWNSENIDLNYSELLSTQDILLLKMVPIK